MAHATFRSWLIVCTVLGIAAPALADEPPDAKAQSAASTSASSTAADAPAATAPAATPAPAAASTSAASAAAPAPGTTAAAPDSPSPEILKKAKIAGYHTKVRHGDVFYCKSEAVVGSRFEQEQCLTEPQLEQTLLAQQQQRDQFQHMLGAPAGSK
jgi:hypothetical protein